MSDEFDSPYLDDLDFPDAPQEQFYPESTLQKLQKMFPNKVFHMKVLLQLYDFCFPKKEIEKPIFEKSESDVIDEIHNTPITLDLGKSLKEESDRINNFYAEEAKLSKRIATIPALIDFAYLYYVWNYDKEAPVHKLPMTIFKFNMITEAMQAPKDELNECFAQCIENYFIRDVRVENPPFMLRTELSPAEIKEKIKIIIEPLCKDIMNKLLSKNTSTSTSTRKTEIPHAEQRPDNLQV